MLDSKSKNSVASSVAIVAAACALERRESATTERWAKEFTSRGEARVARAACSNQIPRTEWVSNVTECHWRAGVRKGVPNVTRIALQKEGSRGVRCAVCGAGHCGVRSTRRGKNCIFGFTFFLFARDKKCLPAPSLSFTRRRTFHGGFTLMSR
jgi:hypothetical protein